jgi:3-hydroxyisobutyrate dehydrogenase-like beta-hydroxyacid dehydrogenase
MSRPTIALLSPGAMGAGVGARLTAAGFTVLTSLDGRSTRSVARAEAAGMIGAADAELAGAGLVLSIVPPADAEPLARRLLPYVAARAQKPLYVDANALNPSSKRALAALLAGAGCDFVDGAILGPPPVEGKDRTRLMLAGPRAAEAAVLEVPGVAVRVLDGPVGAAAALKMCYAGINKGVAGLATAMLLAAERNGASDALRAEMQIGMPDLFKRAQRQVPDMFGKAYRWIAEMGEIAEFLGDDPAAATLFKGMAGVFETMAADVAGDKTKSALLWQALTPD